MVKGGVGRYGGGRGYYGWKHSQRRQDLTPSDKHAFPICIFQNALYDKKNLIKINTMQLIKTNKHHRMHGDFN